MKIKKKIKLFLFIILWFAISYSLCSSHEIPNTSGYVSRRKRFCSTPFYVFIIVSLIVILIYT
jgi:hypothetical protein